MAPLRAFQFESVVNSRRLWLVPYRVSSLIKPPINLINLINLCIFLVWVLSINLAGYLELKLIEQVIVKWGGNVRGNPFECKPQHVLS